MPTMKTLLLLMLVIGFTNESFAQFSFDPIPERKSQIVLKIEDGALKTTSEKNARDFLEHIKKVVEHFEITAEIDVVIREKDLKDVPIAQIFRIPKIIQSVGESYVIHVNPSVLNQKTLSEHVAYHEVCHIVVWKKMENLPEHIVEFIEDEEIRVERQVYFFVGSKRYLEFLLKGGFIPDTGEKIDAEKYAAILQEIFEKPK